MLDGNIDADVGRPYSESEMAGSFGERRAVDTGTGESVDALRLGAAEVYAIVELVGQIPSRFGTVTNHPESTGT
jgi:hypothetical protein